MKDKNIINKLKEKTDNLGKSVQNFGEKFSNKIKEQVLFLSKKADVKEIPKFINQEISNRLLELFDMVCKERENYYENNRHQIIEVKKLSGHIKKISDKNGMISFATSIIPGPWGIAAVIPEIMLVIKNQLMLIYDIGKAHQKDDILNKEMLFSVFIYSTVLSSTGIGKLGIFTIKNGKLILKNISTTMFQKLIELLSGKITNQLLKTTISKFIPVIGAASIAQWTKLSTKLIGHQAEEIFANYDIKKSDNKLIESDIDELKNDVNQNENIEIRLKSLINFMIIDDKIKEKEIYFIKDIIEKTSLDMEVKNNLLKNLENSELFNINYKFLENNINESLPLILDLIDLAKIDNNLEEKEKEYIIKIGKQLSIEKDEIIRLF